MSASSAFVSTISDPAASARSCLIHHPRQRQTLVSVPSLLLTKEFLQTSPYFPGQDKLLKNAFSFACQEEQHVVTYLGHSQIDSLVLSKCPRPITIQTLSRQPSLAYLMAPTNTSPTMKTAAMVKGGTRVNSSTARSREGTPVLGKPPLPTPKNDTEVNLIRHVLFIASANSFL